MSDMLTNQAHKQEALALLFMLLTVMGPISSSAQMLCPSAHRGSQRVLPPKQIFQSEAPVLLKLASNFTKIEVSSENNPDQIYKKMRRSYPAALTLPDGRVVNAKAKAFGDSASNAGEATFRKLHLTLADGTELYIGTHVQTHPEQKWTPQGRLTDGRSPFREALV